MGKILKKKTPPKKNNSKALVSSDPLSLYLLEIRKYPTLDKETEKRVAIQYKETGNPKFAEILVTSNLRFVVKIALEYSYFGSHMIDLIQEGNVGLMKAVKEFNPYKNVRLITYAVWWIKGYIQEYLMKQHSIVKIGTTKNQRKLFYQLKKELKKNKEINFTGETIPLLKSGKSKIKQSEVDAMKNRLLKKDIPFDQNNIEERGIHSFSSHLGIQNTLEEPVTIDESLEKAQELKNLEKQIKKMRSYLNEKEIFILDQRLLSDQPLTLQEIGTKYGTSREAVRQAEERLIKKIKKEMV